MKLLTLAALPLALAVVAGCSSTKKTAESTGKSYTEEQAGAAIENKAAKEVGAKYFADIEFSRGSKNLKESAKAELDSLMRRAQEEGTVKEVKVIAWADEEFPSTAKKDLNKGQRDLAAGRNKSIEKYIKDNSAGVDVDTYNMAERPTKFERLLKTSDAQVKDTMVAAGLPTTATANKYPSKASHAVVMIVVK